MLLTYLSFTFLALSLLSLWYRKSLYLWGSLFAFSYVCALGSGVAEIATLIPIAVLFTFLYFWNKQKKGFKRAVLFVLSALLSSLFILHFLRGFHNWNIVQGVIVGQGHIPVSLWINYDKTTACLFILALSVPLLSNLYAWKKIWKSTFSISLGGVLALMAIAYIGNIRWDPKIPSFYALWTLNNLIFVSVAEETFFRGFLQREFHRWMGESKKSTALAIIFTSLIFAAAHFNWVASPLFLFFVFLAGLLYGGIYAYTGAIESSIFCHFLLNVTHFYFFTYPA